MASVVAVHRLSCPAACGILVPRPGIEPASPAQEGGFLTTGPPGKSPTKTFSNNMRGGDKIKKVKVSFQRSVKINK